jgi:GNAT superfamily N-acetyltransferase
MPRLEITPFEEAHLDEAARLLEERHRRQQEAEPLLTAPADFRAEVAELWEGEQASGAVGRRDGRVVGYVLGIRKSDDVWGPNVWVDPAGHAVDEAEELRDLYAEAAARWVDEGRPRHYALAPATDARLLDAWNRLGFGQQQAMAVRNVPDTEMPDGVRHAEERDLDELVELGPLLSDHQARSPVFSSGPREDPDELREELREDLSNREIGTLVSESDGRLTGCFVIAPTTLSSTHSGVARIDGAALLAWAVTRPDVRGSGAGLALTEGAFAWAHERGYETMVTDWRVTNLLSSRFWPARGFRPTFLRLYRSIP